ncbi:MAG TPA: hypothetical protein ENF37_01410 [Beggiatoa sp.]|nr:hypothetical protein [Beggiatoa sp.]
MIDQEKLVNTMLLSTGVMSGFCLMAGTVFEEFKILLGDDTDLYVFISGLAVLIASINQLQQDILSELFSKKGSYAFFAIILIIFSIIMAIYLDVKILQ